MQGAILLPASRFRRRRILKAKSIWVKAAAFPIPTPWLYCYARVTSPMPVMSEKELWRRLELRRRLEEALSANVGEVTNPDSGHR
ncbi:MAG: hypothetical protein U0992_18710 [Planctomycetaceae bacterium]